MTDVLFVGCIDKPIVNEEMNGGVKDWVRNKQTNKNI